MSNYNDKTSIVCLFIVYKSMQVELLRYYYAVNDNCGNKTFPSMINMNNL